MAGVRVAVVGATGLVGEAILELLADRHEEIEPVAVASADSAGRRVPCGSRNLKVEALDDFDFGSVAIALFAVPPAVSLQHARQAANRGCLVLDLSGIWLADAGVPVWHPHGDALPDADVLRTARIVSVVTGTAAPVADLLLALAELAPRQLAVTSLLPASAAGRAAVEDLGRQSARLLSSQAADPELFPAQSAFQVLAAGRAALGSAALAPGQSLAVALHRLALLSGDAVSGSACWVPAFFGQSLSVSVQCGTSVDDAVVQQLLENAGFELPPERDGNAQTLTESLSSRRIRAIVSAVVGGDQGRVECWLGFDNVRNGAALRGVQMLDMLLKDHLY